MGKTRQTGNIVSDSILSIDIDNDRVGIGSTTPTSTLDVVGIVSATAFYGDGLNLANTGSTLSASSGTERVVLTNQTSGTMTASATTSDLVFDSTAGELTIGTGVTIGVGSSDIRAVGIITANRFQSTRSSDTNFVAGFGALEDGASANSSVYIGYLAGQRAYGSDGNTIVGYEALSSSSNLSSDYNTCIGYRTGRNVTTADGCTLIGSFAGNNQVLSSSTGNYLTAVGYAAASSATSGTNVCVGYYAGGGSTLSGGSNVFVGYEAGRYTTSGYNNIAVGRDALGNGNPVTAHDNIAIGDQAAELITSGDYNTAIGSLALGDVTTGEYNIAVGYLAGSDTDDDINYNTMIGYLNGQNLAGTYNVSMGPFAMRDHDGFGSFNIAIGYRALEDDGFSSSYNIAIGYEALLGDTLTTADHNIGIGYQSGAEVQTGGGNVFIGYQAGESVNTGDNNVVIVAGSTATVDVSSPSASGELVVGSGSTAWITGDSSYNLTTGNDLTVTGALSKGSGSFKIDHPLPELSETNYLVHSFIEGPQADLIYRGVVDLVSGTATINLDTVSRMTEGTFELLCTNVQCFTTNESDWTLVKGSISGNILTIVAQDENATSKVSWMAIGERKDQHMINTEWTDENGRVITEPLKA